MDTERGTDLTMPLTGLVRKIELAKVELWTKMKPLNVKDVDFVLKLALLALFKFVGKIYHLLIKQNEREAALCQEWHNCDTAALKYRDVADPFHRTQPGRSEQQFHSSIDRLEEGSPSLWVHYAPRQHCSDETLS